MPVREIHIPSGLNSACANRGWFYPVSETSCRIAFGSGYSAPPEEPGKSREHRLPWTVTGTCQPLLPSFSSLGHKRHVPEEALGNKGTGEGRERESKLQCLREGVRGEKKEESQHKWWRRKVTTAWAQVLHCRTEPACLLCRGAGSGTGTVLPLWTAACGKQRAA